MDNPNYQLTVKDKAGNIIGEFSDWLNLKFGDRHNNYGQATFDVPVTSADLLTLVSLRRYELYISRNGQIIWSGEQASDNVRLSVNDANLVTITSYTLFQMLEARLTDEYIRFEGIDQGQILKQLVDLSQAKTDGDFGFTFASIPATMSRDREYFSATIMDAFINMSNNINGIDFWVGHDKKIHIVPYRGIDRSNQYIFELGVNMLEPGISNNFSSPANSVRALGAGFDADQLVQTFTDAEARQTYKLREQRISEIDVSEADTLLSKAQDYASKYKQQVQAIDFKQVPNSSPAFGSLSIGDTARIRIRKGRYNINSKFRIYGYDITIGNEGEEYISYLVGDIPALAGVS